MKYIYVAGPIAQPDKLDNAVRAMKVGTQLLGYGFEPHIPHFGVIWDSYYPEDYERRMTSCFAWLEKCDALLRIPGDSPGADREMLEARRLGIPVFLSVGDLLAAQGTCMALFEAADRIRAARNGQQDCMVPEA